MKALVLAAGAGTRLHPFTLDRPKPMVSVSGRPAIAQILEWLARHGIRDIAINLHHHAQVLIDYVGDGTGFGVRVHYSLEESQPLGTAGALTQLTDYFGQDDAFLVVYGDVLTNLDLSVPVELHRRSRADATIVLTHVDDPTRAGMVEFDANSRITSLVEKPRREEVRSQWANAGIYVCGARVLDFIGDSMPTDFARDVFPAMLRNGCKLVACPSSATVFDIGAPERMRAAAEWISSRDGTTSPC